jgi:GNAT superfamily N-acetyltransferase
MARSRGLGDVYKRQVASHAVQKQIRKAKRQMVAVSCHYDIVDWLQPDWIFEPATREFAWRSLQRRPKLHCEVAPLPYEAWGTFAPFHYLTADLNRAARCYGLWCNGTLACFAGVLHRPHPKAKNIKGLSRLVTLPDWQGLGLAFVLSETLGAAHSALGFRFRNYPAHPAFVRAYRSPPWVMVKRPGTMSPRSAGIMGWKGERPCAVFEYRGAAMAEADARALVIPGKAPT